MAVKIPPAQPLRGEIREVDWSPARGSEQSGKRPALVVQNDAGNQADRYPNTIVVALSTSGRDIPFHVRIAKSRSSGLADNSFAKCEQILTVSKSRLSTSPIGKVTSEEMREVEEALLLSLGIDRGPARK